MRRPFALANPLPSPARNKFMKGYTIRKARMGDVRQMHTLMSHFAETRELLPRSLSEIYENLQQFFVIVNKNKIVGTCALYITWDDLAEVKALAVARDHQGKGLGKWLLKTVIAEAKKIGVKTLFTLTIRENLFKKFGFRRVNKSGLPHKVWTECVRCPYFPDSCIETSLVLDLHRGLKPMRKLTDAFMSTSEPMVPNEPTSR
jgi:amino-acid N-acetyltransferase